MSRLEVVFRVYSGSQSLDKRENMKSKPTRAPAKKKQKAVTQGSESISEQTRIFLESGKKIQQIEPGISVQTTTVAKKHISLGNKQKSS